VPTPAQRGQSARKDARVDRSRQWIAPALATPGFVLDNRQIYNSACPDHSGSPDMQHRQIGVVGALKLVRIFGIYSRSDVDEYLKPFAESLMTANL
jgi:hypothetical protein